MKVKVISRLNKRLWPSSQNVALPEPLQPNDILDVKETVEGEHFSPDNNKWHKTEQGFYVWSGGVEAVAPTVPVLRESTGATTDLSKSLALNGPIDFRGTNVCAAVIDSGVSAHPALGGRLNAAKSKSFVAGETSAEDDIGHGTQVAGIIAGNDSVVRGVAPDVSIISYRVAPAGYVDSNAIYYALKNLVDNELNSIDVINLSLDIQDFLLDQVQGFLNTAASKGVVTVVAAGENLQHNTINQLKNVIKVSVCDDETFEKFKAGSAVRDSFIFRQTDIESTSLDNGYAPIGHDSAYAAVVSGLVCSIISTNWIKKDSSRTKNVLNILRNLSFKVAQQTQLQPFKPHCI